jgi:hypothetical protein
MCDPEDRRVRDHHECIWISYSDLMLNGSRAEHLQEFESNSPLALPEADREKIKIGAGTPPVLCKHGWLLAYHGCTRSCLWGTSRIIWFIRPEIILTTAPIQYFRTILNDQELIIL